MDWSLGRQLVYLAASTRVKGRRARKSQKLPHLQLLMLFQYAPAVGLTVNVSSYRDESASFDLRRPEPVQPPQASLGR